MDILPLACVGVMMTQFSPAVVGYLCAGVRGPRLGRPAARRDHRGRWQASSTPIPRGPTVLTLYSAADLLTGPGCPVCRYAGEAGDRYLAWFALEGHANSVTVTRLCTSLGMCARHTRGLMSQPGAARRLTAVYRYLTREARDRLRRPCGTDRQLPRLRAR